MTSRTSTQPLSESTSNRANMAFPTLSKLKLRGLALREKRLDTSIFACRKKILNQSVTKKNKKQAAVPDSWYPETRFLLPSLQFQVEVFGNADINSEYAVTILLQQKAREKKDVREEIYYVACLPKWERIMRTNGECDTNNNLFLHNAVTTLSPYWYSGLMHNLNA